MAAGSIIHTFAVDLADVDRGVYEQLNLRVARHPSETGAFMITRLLAYLLEFDEGISFTEGVAATDEPAVIARDATGAVTRWIEVGAPDATRLHAGGLQGARVAVYTHRDPRKVVSAWAGKRVHRLDEVDVYSFDPGFVDAMAALVERRSMLTLSVTERRIYLELNGTALSSDVHETPTA